MREREKARQYGDRLTEIKQTRREGHTQTSMRDRTDEMRREGSRRDKVRKGEEARPEDGTRIKIKFSLPMWCLSD